MNDASGRFLLNRLETDLKLAIAGADILATARRFRSEGLGAENTLAGALNRFGRMVMGKLDCGVGLSSDVYMKAYNFIRQHHPALMTKLAPVFEFIDRAHNTGTVLRHQFHAKGIAAFQLLGSLLNDIATATLPGQVGPAFAMAGHSGGSGSGGGSTPVASSGGGLGGTGGETGGSSGNTGGGRKKSEGRSPQDEPPSDGSAVDAPGTRINPEDIPGIRAKKGEMSYAEWFDSISHEKFMQYWNEKEPGEKKGDARRVIENRIRHPGGYHEWAMVSRAPKFHAWGIPDAKLRAFRTKTSELTWIIPGTGRPGRHGRKGSNIFHRELGALIDKSKSFEEFQHSLVSLAKRWKIDSLPMNTDDE